MYCLAITCMYRLQFFVSRVAVLFFVLQVLPLKLFFLALACTGAVQLRPPACTAVPRLPAQDMALVRHSYQFSLRWFTALFKDALATCPRSNTGA